LNSQKFSQILLKLSAKLSTIFCLLPEQFPCLSKQKISWEITKTMLSNIFIFVNILKLQFLQNYDYCGKIWEHSIIRAEICAKLLLKYRRNFRCRNSKYYTSSICHPDIDIFPYDVRSFRIQPNRLPYVDNRPAFIHLCRRFATPINFTNNLIGRKTFVSGNVMLFLFFLVILINNLFLK